MHAVDPTHARFRKAGKSLIVPKIDKAIIIDDSQPYGADNQDTQVHPLMNELAEEMIANPPEEHAPDAAAPTDMVACRCASVFSFSHSFKERI